MANGVFGQLAELVRQADAEDVVALTDADWALLFPAASKAETL